MQGITCILSIMGNALVIWVAGFRMALTVTTLCYLNLALADFFFSATLLLFMVVNAMRGQWPYGCFLCKLFNIMETDENGDIYCDFNIDFWADIGKEEKLQRTVTSEAIIGIIRFVIGFTLPMSIIAICYGLIAAKMRTKSMTASTQWLYVFLGRDFRKRMIHSLPASLERALTEDSAPTNDTTTKWASPPTEAELQEM
ncbi:N-formyl peptide receptor 2 [Myotis davidii]|uniref:N-formyl peptide receptor 2 n=1 Tax=Myotis davidii TaxID=225400 RepID=L5LU98_MYODS|nr:N-formyl peptide receptor 2 [Myotis davidii]